MMQINVESLSTVKKKINFEISADRVSSEVEKVFGEIKKRAAIKGFRKGKVPSDIIKKNYNDQMTNDVLKNLINETYFSALDSQNINPVSNPVIESDTLVPGESFKYSATVEVLPEILVKDYEGLKLKKEKFAANEQVVEQRLKEMQENHAQLVPAPDDHVTSLGDFVTFDFRGSIDGVAFEGGSAEDFQLELGSGRFIPGFEDQMVGMKAGDEGEVKVTFPENYGSKELAGKPALFEIKVKDIKVKELPELTDEFAKEFGEFESLENLKDKLRELYELQENDRIEADFRESIVHALIEKNNIDVPAVLVDRQVELMLDSTKKRLMSQRLTLEMMGMDDAGYKQQFRPMAESKVKGALLLEALAAQEAISVTDADIDEKISSLAASSGQDVAAFEKLYKTNPNARSSIASQLKEERVIDLLQSKAEISLATRDEIKSKE